jgi:hypothetical protein
MSTPTCLVTVSAARLFGRPVLGPANAAWQRLAIEHRIADQRPASGDACPRVALRLVGRERMQLAVIYPGPMRLELHTRAMTYAPDVIPAETPKRAKPRCAKARVADQARDHARWQRRVQLHEQLAFCAR